MSAIIVLVVILALFVGTAIAVGLGLTPDTRDSDWSVGRLIAPRS
jgi:hypothetical protein